MKAIFVCLMAFIGLVLTSCQTETARIEQTSKTIQGIKYVTIAVVGGTDFETQDVVRTSLQETGIPCLMYGSLLHDVGVPLIQYKEALKKLRHEPKLKGKWIRFM